MSYYEDLSAWEDQGKPVREHLCDGLREYQAESGGCTPGFTVNGLTEGCDATNRKPIRFCPFCAVELTGEVAKWGDS